ncbi:hypothetical protein [Streptomyces mirabilis]|jgi:hypothetical protein|uniref:hypothetical protein n=1 Tax=Streptomyces mirabilis TaxID=68239 RepID=UPI0036B25A61
MLKLDKTKRAIALKRRVAGVAAAVGLMASLGVATAPSASATSFVCNHWGGVDGSKCQHQGSLHTGGEWSGGSRWNTSDMVLKFQGDGNLVLYCLHGGYSEGLHRNVNAGEAMWASGHSNQSWIHPPIGEKLDFWTDGNLASYEATDQTALGQLEWYYTWDLKRWPGASAWIAVQADGNVVEWANGQAVWASNTYHSCPGTENYWNGYQ